jgi:hypothetical protein
MANYPLLTAGYDANESARLCSVADRVGYYEYLKAHGSIYAGLALGVVRQDTPSGTVAIAYCREYAKRRGVTVTDDKLVQINMGLIRHDSAARTSAFQQTGVNRELPMSTIRAYHAAVFHDVLGTPPETWTAEVPLQCGGTHADDVWIQMLTGSFISVAVDTCLQVIGLLPGRLKVDAYACMAAGQLILPNMFSAGHGMFGNETRLGMRADALGSLTPMQRRAVDYLDILTCSGPIPSMAIMSAGSRSLDEWVRSEADAFGRTSLGRAYLRGVEAQMQSPFGYYIGP